MQEKTSYMEAPYIKNSFDMFEMVRRVCKHFKVEVSDLKSKRRKRNLVDARAVIGYILHKKQGYASTDIAIFIDQDHSNILHHCKKVQGFMDIDKDWRKLVDSFSQM